jgi:TetR/AcrR family transcriptional regulator, transcriptional repressor for nem operon
MVRRRAGLFYYGSLAEAIMKAKTEKAAQQRQHTVETAARLFRERGYGAVGVADLMKSAGLSHADFYANFGSKEELMAEACTHAIGDGLKHWELVAADKQDEELELVASSYLSAGHRDHPGQGCTIAALGPEVARLGPEVRCAITSGVRQHLDKLASLMPPDSPGERREAALVAYASMVGALVLARAVNDPALSEEFMKAVHSAVTGIG